MRLAGYTVHRRSKTQGRIAQSSGDAEQDAVGSRACEGQAIVPHRGGGDPMTGAMGARRPHVYDNEDPAPMRQRLRYALHVQISESDNPPYTAIHSQLLDYHV